MVAPITLHSGGRTLPGWVPMTGLVALLLGVAFIPFAEGVGVWAHHQAMRRVALAPGRACPRVARLSMAALGAKPPKPFDYKGAHVAFQIGDVDCEPVPVALFGEATFPVCRFTAPGGIEVTAHGRTTVFEPGVGHSATVAIRPDGATCKLGGAMRVEETR